MKSVIRSTQALGAHIRRMRKESGLTQAELGSRTKLRQATISSLENGEGATLDTLFAVITILKLELVLTTRSTSPAELDEIF